MFEAFGWNDLIPLAQGAILTLGLCVTSGIFGTIFGLLLGLASTSPSRIARAISALYVYIIRGIPILVIIFMIYFGLPLMFPELELSKFSSAVVALSIYAAAYVAEIVRGSIEAVPPGQGEAADALGLAYYPKFRYVIVPQAMRIIVPPGIGFLIGLVKDSSLVTVIGYVELTKSGNIVANLTNNPIATFLTVGAMYFVICYGISLLGRWYEKRTGIHVESRRLKMTANI
ncbi:amino acid ABC transporter permease [Arthrobacter sp. 2MCAF14]|uniref:amino acid ABC transporter permease n=1 Tax=Arthrobacter sp. 2MCAF14 TaxID=3232982 RepID=UPI003F9271D9